MLAAAWLLLAVQASAIPPADPLDRYLAVAERYRTEEHGAAVDEIRGWPLDDVRAAVAALRKQADRLRSVPSAPGEIGFRAVEAAVLMHAEAGLLALHALRSAEAETHLEASVTLFEWARQAAARRRRRGLPFPERIERRDYYLALAAAALAVGFPPAARSFADSARREASLDPDVHLVRGCVAEGIAYELLLQHRTWDAARMRDEAEQALGDAIALDGGRQEARLHLGKLHLDRGRLVEAEPLLAEVETRAEDDRQRYLARLLLGRLAERRGRPDEATGFYRRALEAWPDSQAARLALGHALERRSGPAASRPLVAASLAASRRLDRAEDPWWRYGFGPPGLARSALDRLWRKVLDR